MLAMKAKTNNMHAIFLLKKNIKSNIIKAILGYSPIAVPEMTITLVRQGYKSIEGKQDYRTRSEITYGEREVSIDIRKSKNNYSKDRKPRCFNCNIYGHIEKDCQKLKKEKETRKCCKL